MPIFKYHSFKEAEKSLWNFHPDEEYLQKVAELWKFAAELYPIEYPKGIFKFKSIEEANEHRKKIELEFAKKKLKRK